MIRGPPSATRTNTLCPSATLVRSRLVDLRHVGDVGAALLVGGGRVGTLDLRVAGAGRADVRGLPLELSRGGRERAAEATDGGQERGVDPKSTRLNSSH